MTRLIIDIAETHNVRLILITQPTIWRADLTEAEQAWLWFGQGPGEFFYSIEALARGMSMTIYNDRLLKICHQRQVECVDLANVLPKDTAVFYDDVHFNKTGSVQVAQILTTYLLSEPPFTQHNIAE